VEECERTNIEEEVDPQEKEGKENVQRFEKK